MAARNQRHLRGGQQHDHLTGDVVPRQDQNVATGDRLTVNTVTNDSKLEANAPGAGPNRVRSVLYPDSAPGKPPEPQAGR